MSTATEPRMSYVATCTGCKQPYAVTVDDADMARDNARAIAKWIRQGATIERMTVEQAREAIKAVFGCTCPRKPRKRK